MFSKFNFRRRRGALKTFNVVSLDGATLTYHLEGRALADELLRRALEVVCVEEEKEYFGLVTFEQSYPKWLQLNKPLKKQLAGKSPYTVHFRVRIYPRDHHSLLHSNTRHQVYLQVKQDLYENRLRCSTEDATHRLAALAVQMEIGDFNHRVCGAGYLRELQILETMTSEMEQDISQLHILNRGKTDAECEEEFLDLVQEEQNYGVAVFQVQDGARQTLAFGVSPAGVTINLGATELHNFEWDSISRVACKGKYVTLYVSKTHARPAYQLQYSCLSACLATSTAAWCSELLTFFGTPALEERPKSRLRRFFSSRRSLRRRDNIKIGGVVRSHTHTGQTSGLIQRRVVRRLSVGEDKNKNSTSNRASVRSPPAAATDNKLIVYGASGLASSNSSTTLPLRVTTATTTTATPTSVTTQHETTGSTQTPPTTTQATPTSSGGPRSVELADALADRKSVSSLPLTTPLWEGRRGTPLHLHSHSDVLGDSVSEGGGRRTSVPVFPSSQLTHTASPASHPHKKPPTFSPRNSYHYGSHRHDDYQSRSEDKAYNDRSLPRHGDHRHGNHTPTSRSAEHQLPAQSNHRHGNHMQNEERDYRESSPHASREHILNHHGDNRHSDKAYRSSPHINSHHRNGDNSPHRHSNHQLTGEHAYNRHSNHSSNQHSPSRPEPQNLASPHRYGNHQSPKLYYNVRPDGISPNASPPSHRHTPHTASPPSHRHTPHTAPHTAPHTDWYSTTHRAQDFAVTHSQPEAFSSHLHTPSHPHTPSSSSSHPHTDSSPHVQPRARRPSRERPTSGSYKSRSLPTGTNPCYRVNGGEEPAVPPPPPPREPLDPAHPARPQNRGPFRLSLQDNNYYHYDNGRLYSSARYPSKQRRSRTTTVGSTSSLSQPAEISWGMSSQLGSIASLEYQASVAELSQAESPSYMDAHTRSFVFEASQGAREQTGTEL